MRLDNALRDRQSQPGTAARNRAGGMRAPGRAPLPGDVEDPLHLLVCEAAAGIGDAELDAPGHRPAGHLDDAIGAGEQALAASGTVVMPSLRAW